MPALAAKPDPKKLVVPPYKVVSRDPLPPKKGYRVQIHVEIHDLSREQCTAIIDLTRHLGAPDGQIAVRIRDRKPEDPGGPPSYTPYCVENFDGKGVFFNEWAKQF